MIKSRDVLLLLLAVVDERAEKSPLLERPHPSSRSSHRSRELNASCLLLRSMAGTTPTSEREEDGPGADCR